MNPDHLLTHSLKNSPHGPAVTRILAAALEAVEPGEAVRRHLRQKGQRLVIGARTYDLEQFERVVLIAFGKASLPMAQAAADILGKALRAGIVVTKTGSLEDWQTDGSPASHAAAFQIFQAGHPVPEARSLQASAAVLDLLTNTTSRDLVLFLISGGGSALLTLPAPGITLAEIQSLTQALLACGATIHEINTLRKHLDQVKGGQLTQIAAPAQIAALILSDVIGDPLEVIASGPTVPDPSTFAQAQAVLEQYGIAGQTPQSIGARLQAGAAGRVAETPKPGDPIFEHVHNLVVGNNYLACRAAIDQARREGFHALLLTTELQGEARQAGAFCASILRQAAQTGDPLPRPACLIAGGETTVTIRGEGLGGRNQELALAAAPALAGLPEVMLVTLASDGEDGPTDAAGAVVTGQTAGRARLHGQDPAQFLARNDAYHFFDPLGDLLKPGATRTNVNDLIFLFAFQK